MKKLLTTIICAIAVFGMVCNAEKISDVTCEMVKVGENDNLKIEGRVDTEFGWVTVAVVEDVHKDVILDGTNAEINPSDYVLYMNDTAVNEDSFTFTIPISEQMSDKALHIRVGTAEETYTFDYITIGTDKKDELIGYVDTQTADELFITFRDNGEIYTSLGYRIDLYNSLDEEGQRAVCVQIANGERPYENPQNAVNLAIFTSLINFEEDGEKAEWLFNTFFADTKIDIENDTEYKLIKEKDSLSTFYGRIVKEGPYSSFGALLEKYNEIKSKLYDELILSDILDEINSADYDTILDVLKKYEEFCGMDVKEAAEDMTSSNLDKFLRELCDTTFTDKESCEKIISDLTTKYKKKKSSSSGTGGGGGGVSVSTSNNSKAPSFTPVLSDNQEEKEENIFDDIDNVLWAKDAIIALYEKKVINGVGEKTFAPNAYATREQAVKMIVGAFGIEADGDASLGFSDVVESAWYYDSIKAAYQKGIVSGVNEEVFGIGDNMTRQDLVTILYRLIKDEQTQTENESVGFEDKDDIAPYAAEAVGYFSQKGIVNGVAEGDKTYFLPKKNVTRAELAKILYGVMGE